MSSEFIDIMQGPNLDLCTLYDIDHLDYLLSDVSYLL